MPTPTVAGDTLWSECAALLRDDFASFAACCFRELNPRARLAMNWHVEVMAGKLAAVREGRIRRLMICVPPRHLKSHVASVCFPAWYQGHDSSAQIICASYAQDLADKLSRDCRRIVASDRYQRLFPTRQPCAVVSNSGVACRCGESRVAKSCRYQPLATMCRQSRDNLSARSCA